MAIRQLLLACLLLSPAALADDDPLKPAERDFLFDYSSTNFSSYQVAMRAHVSQQRVFLVPEQREFELDMVLPFELLPPEHCEGPSRGILLVHGILDTAFAMRDIGAHLNADCFHVRALLLPGHGTRPGELIDVTAEDWLTAVRFGVGTFSGEVDEVYIGGFSLGGLLATIVLLEDESLVAGVLFAPALKTTYAALSRQASWLKSVRTWLNTDESPLPIRYQAMTTNSVAQVTELIKRYRMLAEDGVSRPAYVVASVDDLAVDGKAVTREFVRRFTHPNSRLEVYGDIERPPDSRSRVFTVYDEEARIRDMSHVAIPYHPDNFLFGRDSDYRDCGQVLPFILGRDVEACENGDENWRGELSATIPRAYKPMQRLTFNPFFDETMSRVTQFLRDNRP